MPAAIKEIHIKKLGPIAGNIDMELGKLNLIKGYNDAGKTLLVEFLLRSMFKTRGWALRPPTGTGKIIVTGLADQPVTFSPSSSKKFEDYYSGVTEGISTDLSKLLVIKGSEVELGDRTQPDKIILQRYLSGREILEKIETPIKVTIKEAYIENREIHGDNKGEIKRRDELKSQIKNIDTLFTEINKNYLGGQRKLLENRGKELEEDIKKMDTAKRFHAYTISNKIEQLKTDRNIIDDLKLEDISKQVDLYWQKKDNYNTIKEQYQQVQENSKHFSWVKNAALIYKELLQKTPSKTINNLLFAPFLILIALVGVFSFLNLFFAVVGALAALIIFVCFYLRSYNNALKNAGKNNELEKINIEYLDRFGQPLTNIALLNARSDELEPDFNKSNVLKQQLAELEIRLQAEENQISRDLNLLFEEKLKQAEWITAIQKKKENNKKLDKEIQEYEKKLIELNVDETGYIIEEPAVKYDKKVYEKLLREQKELYDQIQTLETGLNNLKGRICPYTNDDISVSWELLIQHLKEKYSEISKEFADLTARIVGQIAVVSVITEFRKVEDEKIKDALELEAIKKPLYDLTHKYTGFRLDGDQLIVVNPYEEFPLNVLGSGSQDDVFLALRMGFASKMLNQDSLFLILDDAFLTSDWTRRPLLVDKIIELVRNGWQVIYLTMDEHIKELFDTKGKVLGTEYKYFPLS